MDSDTPGTTRAPSKSWEIQIGGRRIYGTGLEREILSDFFHYAMTISWLRLIGLYLITVAVVNLLFAGLYSLGADTVIGAHPPSFPEIFFFSVAVFGTVSFGGVQPGSLYGHTLVTTEIILGIGSYAVMTGLAFARFSRPRAHLLFTRHPLMATHEGQPALMLRVANARHNYISNAHAKMWLIASDRGEHASRARRFYRLQLLRDDNPMFMLSWTLFHVIDEHSPLYGMDAAEFAAIDANLIVIISGFDENYGQEVRARHLYTHDDVRWNHQYADIIHQSSPGVTHVDYGKFHDLVPLVQPTVE
jgi:inward rectifier potassium channel